MPSINKKLGERILRLRKNKNFRQQKLAELLGIKRPSLSHIEDGTRFVTADELLKLAQIFNTSIDELLNFNKPLELVLSEDKEEEKEPRQKPVEQIRISVPQRNITKFKEVLLYILNKVGAKPNIGETVLYKLLFYIDFDYYERYEEQLIGATYIKNHHGPTPKEFAAIVKKMENKDIIRVKDKYFDYPQTKYLPLREPDLTKLNGQEIELIDEVLNKLSDMNANQISAYAHNDVPWITTETGKVIPYESVFYRTLPYSVRKYEQDI